MTPSCFLLDHDDTLIPTFAMRARGYGMAVRELLGIELDAAAYLRAHPGETVEQSSLRLTEGDAPRADALNEHYRALYYRLSEDGITPFPGIREMLTELHARGLPVAVVTSKVRWGAQIELQRAGLDGLVGHITGSEDVPAHKPAPDPLLHALTALGREPGEALMIGDTAADLLAARAAGTMSGLALWGAYTGDAEALHALTPTWALVSPADVLHLLDAG